MADGRERITTTTQTLNNANNIRDIHSFIVYYDNNCVVYDI